MGHHISNQFPQRLTVLVGVIATLLVLLTLSASSASASSPYCGGEVRSNYGTCWGAARNVSEVIGWGNEKSVCVGVAPLTGKCSSGPWAFAVMSYGVVYHSEPWIQDNAAGKTTMWGEAF